MTPDQTPENYQTTQYEHTDTYGEQNEIIQISEQETHTEVLAPLVDEKFSELETNISINQRFDNLRNQIADLRVELRKAKRGRGKEVRKTNKYINDWFDKLEFNIKKVQSGKFTNLNPHHIEALAIKVQTLISNATNYKSQLVTGDLDEAKKFFPPNVFDDETFYIPDVKKGDFDKKKNSDLNVVPTWAVCIDQAHCTPNEILLSNGTVGERFAQYGLLGAIDAGIDKAGASADMRARTYKVGNLVRSATKLWVGIYAGWNFLKSTRKTITGAKAGDGESHFGNMAKYGAMLGGMYVLWPSIDKLVKWGDTSQWLAEKRGGGLNNSERKIQSQEALLAVDSKVCNTLFKDIPWSDWSQFCDKDGKLELERFKLYIATQDGENSDRYRLLVEQEKQRPRVEQFVVNTLWITPLFLKTQQSENPKGNIEEPYKNLKRTTDAIAEQYDGNDAAQVRTSLDQIEQGMNTNNDPNILNFKSKKKDLEREANILYIKHKNARPITMIYEDNKLYLQTYNEKTLIDISAEDPGVVTPYTETKRKTVDYNETMRIAHLVNFLTSPAHELTGESELDEAFHVSTLWDIEFSKDTRINTIKTMQLNNYIDISVLEDSFFSPRFEELYPSIEADKAGFVTWINSFKKDGKSIWKK